MAIVTCEMGHVYDDLKHQQCPYCVDKGGTAEFTFPMDSDMTIATEAEFIDEVESKKVEETVGIDINSYGDPGDFDKTIGAYSFEVGTQSVTGWIVCTEGKSRGRDYRLFHGWNRIGRNFNLTVCIPDDPAISRESHVAIVYDDKSNKFFAVNEHGNLSYVNGEPLENTRVISNGDTIELGESKFVFIPFCTEDRKW